MATVRYLVSDVSESVKFYVSVLGFELEQQFGPAFAIVTRDDLTLWLAGPKASASRPMPDGVVPTPGGWSRFVLTIDDLDIFLAKLRADRVEFRNEVVDGVGGRAILCLDPSGNVIELIELAR